MLTFRIDPKRVGWILGTVVVCLVSAHLVGQYSKYCLDHDNLMGFVGLFDLDHEGNIPAWFASAVLFISSMLLAGITCLKRAKGDSFSLHWGALSAIFLFLAVDEAIGLHERLSGFVSSMVSTRGIFLFAWTIPYGVGVVLFALVYLKFLFRLPVATRWLFVLAGTVYVGGALGMEMIEGQFVFLYGQANMAHALMVAFEECLEMSGVVLFIYALLSYLGTQYGVVQVEFGDRSGNRQGDRPI